MIPKQVDKHMRDALTEAVRILFPIGVEFKEIIGRHAWRNKKYVGEVETGILTWRGWSANLAHIHEDYRGVYFDFVENRLDPLERTILFGEQFSKAIESHPSFVVAYVAGFPHEASIYISNHGFVVRSIGRNLHGCVVISPSEFLKASTFHWAAHIARLINLQRCLLGLDYSEKESLSQEIKKRNRSEDLEWEQELGLLDF